VYTRYTNVSRLIAGSNKTSRGWDGGGRGPCSRSGTEHWMWVGVCGVGSPGVWSECTGGLMCCIYAQVRESEC